MQNLRIVTLLAIALIPMSSTQAQTAHAQGTEAGPIRVMILDGQSGGSYHNWKLTTPILREELEETGLFQVTVVTAPPADGDFSNFKPEFGNYQVIVSNY